MQRTTNWANKPTGSRSLNWFVVNPWKDDDESSTALLAQLEERYTGIAEVKGSNPVRNYKRCVYNCDDLS